MEFTEATNPREEEESPVTPPDSCSVVVAMLTATEDPGNPSPQETSTQLHLSLGFCGGGSCYWWYPGPDKAPKTEATFIFPLSR